ncbi:MAG TPA: alpha/beta hydrolase [Candidatus Alistipes intestinipullorum]|nr:alpha/beta hydrolase [Candidatus Alistipes intestinipullorum]
MKSFVYAFSALMAVFFSAGIAAHPIVLPLYPDGSVHEIADGGTWEPEVHVYLPETSGGLAVVVCPGGGYKGLSFGSEGQSVAKWLNERGIAAIVVRYRMPRERADVPCRDVAEAFRITRSHAAEWGIDPDRVGIMGFSAGGHLASMALTTFKSDIRPDFGILVYPVISMIPPEAHGGSKANLLGHSPEEKTMKAYSSHLRVTAQTPPTLLVHCSDDPAVTPANSVLFYEALVHAGVRAELHIFPEGGHGWGFGAISFRYRDEFESILTRWLSEQNER